MATQGDDATGFWIVVGRAVENPSYMQAYRKQPNESDEDYRRRLEAIEDVELNSKDLEALIRQVKPGKTILDQIEDCKLPISNASYRT
jgi:hypothetical protein